MCRGLPAMCQFSNALLLLPDCYQISVAAAFPPSSWQPHIAFMDAISEDIALPDGPHKERVRYAGVPSMLRSSGRFQC